MISYLNGKRWSKPLRPLPRRSQRSPFFSTTKTQIRGEGWGLATSHSSLATSLSTVTVSYSDSEQLNAMHTQLLYPEKTQWERFVPEQQAANAWTHARRSTRLLHSVPIRLRMNDPLGRPASEETATISINCHGCRFFSQRKLRPDAWLTMEIGAQGNSSRSVRARVAWVQRSRRLRGLYQVGAEFQTPANLWAVSDPPDDWKSFEAAPTAVFDLDAFAQEMNRLLTVAASGTYYQLLDVTSVAPRAEIKRRFYALARRFHPDRHMDRPEWTASLQKLMESLTQAYKTLADETARERYDQRLAQSGAFTLRQPMSEEQKSAAECVERARECLRAQNYLGSIVWLRQAVQQEPGSSKYHALLGRSLAAVPQYRREAVTHFERALELDPLNLWACYQFGQLYEAMGLPWRARPCYQRVTELDPLHAGAREGLRRCDLDKTRKPAPGPRIVDRILHRSPK